MYRSHRFNLPLLLAVSICLGFSAWSLHAADAPAAKPARADGKLDAVVVDVDELVIQARRITIRQITASPSAPAATRRSVSGPRLETESSATIFTDAHATRAAASRSSFHLIPNDASIRRPGNASQSVLEIYVFDMGQADSLLVVGPPPGRRTLLVDMGETSPSSKNYEKVAHRIVGITGRPHLDYFLATHFHADHLGGESNGIHGLLTNETEPIRVDTVIDNGPGDDGHRFFRGDATRNTLDTYAQTMDDAGDKVGTRVAPQFGHGQIDLGPGVTVEILTFASRAYDGDTGALAAADVAFPQEYEGAPPNENDLSIGLQITVGDFEFFTAGDLTGAQYPFDADDSAVKGVGTYHDGGPLLTRRAFGSRAQTYTNVESRMAQHWEQHMRESDVEVYRANHHGSEYSTTQRFLNALGPEFVIYSC